MINLFEYSDFRAYLSAWYETKKKANPVFSFQHIADKAGIKNKGFIYNIIKGTKQLSKTNTFKLSKALGHNRSDADYFETLVAFNQATDLAEQKHLFEKLKQITNTGKPISEIQIMRSDQYEYLSKWHHATVRSIIGMYTFKGDFKWLAKMVNPPISVPHLKHSVKLLEKLGLIKKDAEGVFRVSANSLSTGKDVKSVAFQNFHLESNELAKRAISEFPLEKRNMTGLTMGISDESYGKICAAIEQCQQTIIGIAENDKKANCVYQLNFQLFPTSNNDLQRIIKC